MTGRPTRPVLRYHGIGVTTCTPGHREACWTATTPAHSCECQCGGVHHGCQTNQKEVQMGLIDEGLSDLETHPDIEAYYDAYPEARHSGESDYGVWWKDDDGGNWRVTYVHHTGHYYALHLGGTVSRRLAIAGNPILVSSGDGRSEGPVLILGQGETCGDLTLRDTEPSEVVLEGWAEPCGSQGSLAWAVQRIRERAPA